MILVLMPTGAEMDVEGVGTSDIEGATFGVGAVFAIISIGLVAFSAVCEMIPDKLGRKPGWLE